MRYWLFKSEPSVWGWDDQVAKGDAGEEWDGVRNYQARNFMREMAVGDLGFFYHSQKEKSVVGIVEVCAAVHPDSSTDEPESSVWPVRAVWLRASRWIRVPVILPFLTGCSFRTYAAIFSFCAGVMPPMPIFGRSLL